MNAPLRQRYALPAARAARGLRTASQRQPVFNADDRPAPRLAPGSWLDRPAAFIPSDNRSVGLPRRCQSLQENHCHD